MPFIVSAYILAFCRVIIALAFLVSSLTKARDIPQFKQTISNFQILPTKVSGIIALLFLGGEFIVFLLMLSGGPLLLIGFSLAIFLLILFSIALLTVLHRKLNTSCNCFGASTKQVSYFDVCRNTGFILCASGGCTLASVGDVQRGLSLPGWILTGLGATVFVIIWVQLGEIVQLFRQS